MPAEKADGPVSGHFDEAYPWEENKLVVGPKSRGKGKLLREDLRRLPKELLTDEIEDGDKVHELDPEYVRDEVALDAYEKAVNPPEPEEEPEVGVPEWKPVRQDFVDMIILRVMKALLESAMARIERGAHHGLKVYHLWFPRNDIREYELRPGNPPGDAERPEHLKHAHIVVDPFAIPERIMDMIKADPKKREKFQKAVADGFGEQVRLQYLKAGLVT